MRMIRAALIAAACAMGLAGPATAQVFEVIHPDVRKGGMEFESLNGISLGSVEGGEERSAHEFAVAYSPFDVWKTTFAVEVANEAGESAGVEAIEWENVMLLPFGGSHHHDHGHDHNHDHDHDHGHDHGHGGGVAVSAVALFVGFELPVSGGIDAGGAEIGPIAEIAFGPVEAVTNLFFEIPFEDEEGTGLAYAVQAQYPVADWAGLGFEAHGGVENVFKSESEDSHFIGPAVFTEFEIGDGAVVEPRVALLFGVTDETPDAVVSFNLELKY